MSSTSDDEIYSKLIVDALHGGIEQVGSFLKGHNVSSLDTIFHKVCHPAWDQTLCKPMRVIVCSTEGLMVVETFLRDL